MFNGLVYWLGAKGCATVGVVGSMITSESICSAGQTWNMGLVLLGAATLFVAYLTLRRRS